MGESQRETRLLCQAGTCHDRPLSLQSPHSPRWREDRESFISCILYACGSCPREGRVQLHWSVSLALPDTPQPTHLLPELSHYEEEFLYWGILLMGYSLLSPNTSTRAGYILQPDTWVAVCSQQSFVWKALLVVSLVWWQGINRVPIPTLLNSSAQYKTKWWEPENNAPLISHIGHTPRHLYLLTWRDKSESQFSRESGKKTSSVEGNFPPF